MAAPLMSQDQPVVYTRVAFWDIARQNWDGYQKSFEKYEQPVFEKLLAEGVITEWGADAVGVHSAEGPTHSTWFSAKSISSLEQLFNAGTISTYALSGDYIHASSPGDQATWFVVADAAALDKVDAAFEAARNKHTPEEREAIMRAFEEITVDGSHRDDMSRILHYSSK